MLSLIYGDDGWRILVIPIRLKNERRRYDDRKGEEVKLNYLVGAG